MKRLIWVIFLLTWAIIGSAQDKKSYKSPLTKNYKLWKKKPPADSQPVPKLEPKRKKEPETKNRYSVKYYRRKGRYPAKTNTVRRPLKGPKAKNYKPWTNNGQRRPKNLQ